jgi:hypothetical protein
MPFFFVMMPLLSHPLDLVVERLIWPHVLP